MGLLEIIAADFRAGNLGGNRQNRNARAMTVEQSVNQMQISRTATSRAHRQLASQVSIRACGKRRRFFMPGMDPGDIASLSQRLRDSIEAVPNDAVDAAHADRMENIDNQIRYFSVWHDCAPSNRGSAIVFLGNQMELLGY